MRSVHIRFTESEINLHGFYVFYPWKTKIAQEKLLVHLLIKQINISVMVPYIMERNLCLKNKMNKIVVR